MELKDMTLSELKSYKASVEVYGSPAELIEVIELIKDKERNEEKCTSTGD